MRTIITVLTACVLAACGTNQFEQELVLERAATLLARETVAGGYALVTAEELQAERAAGLDPLLLDAMPAESFAREHLPGALHFAFPKEPLEAWDAAAVGGKSVADFVALLGADKARRIVVYCGYVQCARSHNAARWALRNGYTNVARFAGGLHAWKGAGFALEGGA